MSSKSKDCIINLNYIFHVLDLIVGVLFCVDSYFVISTANSLPRIVLPIYYFVFGLIIIVVIFYAPSIIANMLIFYWTFIGRSFSFLFLSAPLISFGSDLDIACGSFTLFVGVIYLIFSVVTIQKCAVINTALPAPIFQREKTETKTKSVSTNNETQTPKQKTWKYKEKEKKKNANKWKWNKKKNANMPYTKQQSHDTNDTIEAGTVGNIKDRKGMYDNAITSDNDMNDKLNDIKKERDKDIKTMDSKKKQKATNVLKEYADNKVEHIKDINSLNTEMKDINKSNAVSKMTNLGLMSEIFVNKNVFERYSLRNSYSNMLLNGENNEIKSNDNEYTKMYVLNMMNSGLLTKLTKEQEIEFEKLLLYSLETVDKLYLVELTRSDLNNALLEKILNVLIQRSKNESVFGPEIFHCESNKITDNGMKFIMNYITENDKDLRVIKAGHMFTTISSEICKAFGEVLDEKNKYLLKLSIDIQWAQYQTKIDKALMRNNDMFRNERNNKTQLFDDDKEYEIVEINEPIEIQTQTQMIAKDNEIDMDNKEMDQMIVVDITNDNNKEIQTDVVNDKTNDLNKDDNEINNITIDQSAQDKQVNINENDDYV